MKAFLFAAFVTALFSFSLTSHATGNTQTSLQALKAKLARLGEPKIKGTELVGGRTVPAIYFGKTKINNSYVTVDSIKKANGGTATIFVKDGQEFVRVSTNVLTDDGTRAVGTNLARNKAYDTVSKGETFCGDVEIMGTPYDTCYEPIKSGTEVIGIYYVGFKK